MPNGHHLIERRLLSSLWMASFPHLGPWEVPKWHSIWSAKRAKGSSLPGGLPKAMCSFSICAIQLALAVNPIHPIQSLRPPSNSRPIKRLRWQTLLGAQNAFYWAQLGVPLLDGKSLVNLILIVNFSEGPPTHSSIHSLPPSHL